MLGRYGRFLAVSFALLLLGACASESGRSNDKSSCYNTSPLPEEASVIVPPGQDVPGEFARFSGIWTDGRWSAWGFDDATGPLCTTLVVSEVNKDGSASVIYSWGDAPSWGITKGWVRRDARIVENEMLVKFYRGASVLYVLQTENSPPVLKATRTAGPEYGWLKTFATLKK
ncbi:hypothetical protein HYW58_02420 [Candidatus Kaiserbacteria bacterium]|nr:hypothetical protein [Candidatus Kaiserbacteria bacterium]